ncbi:unnamed protein product [Schistosoma turkestanicum]|nr:unnamed protein product [Schistosoma turkestanicum]
MGTPVELLTALEIEAVLCGLRVSQMTHTYEDLDAITKLLEEKQTDLELAAKIGKNLLAKVHDLQSRLLEAEKSVNDRDEVISQLNHNLTVKDNLLRIFLRDSGQITDINDDQSSIVSSGRVSPVRSHQGLSSSAGGGNGFCLSSVNFSQLHKKLEDLEEENNLLRQERNRLSATADKLDEHETVLVRDCTRELIAANMRIDNLSDELVKKADAYMNQQSENTRLLTRNLDLENRVRQLTTENEMLVSRLNELQMSYSLLASELKTSRDKYDECLTLYNEARSENRTLRKRSRRGYYRPNSLIPSNSLLNNSVLPTIPSSYSNGATLTPQSDPNPFYDCHRSCLSSYQVVSDGSTSSLDMLTTRNPDSEHLGSSLAVEIKETATDNIKSNELNCHVQQPTNPNYLLESEKRHSWFDCGVTCNSSSDKGYYSIRDSGMNFQNSFDDSLLSYNRNVVCSCKSYRNLPQRLKLIKPIDGSNVLQHWQHLATPSFTRALFEAPLPGVQSRAGVSDSTNVNCPTLVNTTDSRHHPVSVGSSPISSSSRVQLECSNSLTAHSSSDVPQVQANMKPAEESLKKCADIKRFGSDSPTCFLNNQFRTRSLDHLVIGPSSSTYRDRISNNTNNNESIQFHQSFDHVKRNESASSYLSSFSVTSLVSALLPFATTILPSASLSDKRGVSVNNETTTKTSHNELTRLRLKYPSSSTTGLEGLLDVNTKDTDLSESLLHRTSASILSTNNNVSNSVILSNPQSSTIIPASVSRGAISHSLQVRTSNSTEITEQPGSPPKPENGQQSLSSLEKHEQSKCEFLETLVMCMLVSQFFILHTIR